MEDDEKQQLPPEKPEEKSSMEETEKNCQDIQETGDIAEKSSTEDKAEHDIEKAEHDREKGEHDIEKAEHDREKAEHDREKAEHDREEGDIQKRDTQGDSKSETERSEVQKENEVRGSSVVETAASTDAVGEENDATLHHPLVGPPSQKSTTCHCFSHFPT